MKSSLAKTFDDIASSRNTVDLVYGKIPRRDVFVDWAAVLPQDKIYVVHSGADKDFQSNKVATLLVNSELREKYEAALKAIEDESQKIVTFLKWKLGRKSDAEVITEITTLYGYKEAEMLPLLESLEDIVKWERQTFKDLDYSVIFDPKVVTFLWTKDFRAKLEGYMSVYDRLIGWSRYFRKWVFNHNHADAVADSLRENGFFSAQHEVILSWKDWKKGVTSADELAGVINEERESIINDPELRKSFEAIDKAITKNGELRMFRRYLEDYLEILPELADVPAFKKKVLTSYLQEIEQLYNVFLTIYQASKAIIWEIVEEAKKEQEDWKRVIGLFNDRFYVPFKLRIGNQEDVILKSTNPRLEYDYNDGKTAEPLDVSTLMDVLSTGEKRAHYILNILFEIEARKKEDGTFLLIFDDIADSFDYGNKYAIIEYLRDISENGKFRTIILTHNFDFFRLASSRLDIHRKASYVASKDPEALSLTPTEDLKVFNNIAYLRDHFHEEPRLFVAAIPFVRNLIEYSLWKRHPDYIALTNVLHLKEGTADVTVGDIFDVLNRTFWASKTCSFDSNEKIINQIYRLANEIVLEGATTPGVENKIVLSIAARLKAEEIMILEINDPTFVSWIRKDQTLALCKRYEQDFSGDAAKSAKIRTFKQLLLVTSENIHINSFMYEPILDTDERKLKDLYLELGES